jgi:TonB-linked SusC/RagA family outer membrane protein
LIAPHTNTGAYSEVPGVGNPLADLANSNSKNRGFRAVANIFGEYKIMEPLSFRTSFGVDYGYLDNVNFTPAFYVSPQQQNELNDLSIRKENNSSLLFENTLTFDKRFENHNFNVLAGYTMQRLRSNILGLAAENIIGETSNLWYINKSNINPNSIQNEVNANYNYSLLSYLFRVNYTFQSKYLFTASYRRDGSSKFSKDNRYGNFPSFAVGWNLMNENFMQNNTLFNKIKLRSSWGRIGNEKISYLDQYALVLNDVSPVFGLNETINPGSTYGKAGNRNIKWETTTQTDVGLELGLWDDKITSEIDYYNRVTDNILVELSTPGYTGNGQGQKIRYNAGKVQNSGLEMNVAYNGKKGLLNYRISAIASTINNKVLSVGGNSGVDSTLVGGFLANGQSVTLTKEGLPIGAFYGYQVSGIYQNAEQLNSLPKESLSEVGDLIYVDSNNDGKINSKDRVFIGSPIPKFIYGLSFEASFKSFEFNLDFQGQTGNKIYNGKEAVRPDLYNFENHVIDRWTGEGTSNSEPKATVGGVNWLPSQRFLQDGSFIRLRNITIAYKVPDSSLKRLRLSNAKIFIRGTNVWTLTKFTGYTPEITSSDVLSAGIDNGIYPITAVYTTGININF